MSEAFICDYIRTPIGRYAGALSSVRTDDLAAYPLKALQQRNPHVDWESIDDVILGCANQAGEDNRNIARMAVLLSGLATTTPGVTVNRLCASGMTAVIDGARAIKSNEADLVIAGGVENMSRAPMVVPKADTAFSRNAQIYDTTLGWRFVNPAIESQYGVDSMPETGENVAEQYRISRQCQDRFALESQNKAIAAQSGGRLAKEIAPVTFSARKAGSTTVDTDEHPRITSMEQLQALRALLRENGTITAGNAAGINDGAAALLLASEKAVAQYGLNPIARIAGSAAAGIEPRIMGMGPVPAIRKLCRTLKIAVSKFDVIELNEAFASQVIAVCRELGIDEHSDTLNPNGGAIALGHPLGMSGARITGTAALELAQSRGSLALAALCVGVGQGVAIGLESV